MASGSSRWSTAGVLAVCALLLAPTLTYRMGLDHGVFAYMGAELLDGRWPYVGTWDHAFPGLVFLHGLEIFAFGKSIAMFRLFDLLVQLTTVALVYRIARVVTGGTGAYLAAAIYALIYQGWGPWNTAQREGFGMPFVLLGYWLCLTAERRRAVVTAGGIGLALGFAALIKPTLLTLGLFYAPLIRRLDRAAVRPVLAAALGLLAPCAGVLIVYWAMDALVPLYEACIAYQAQVYVHRLRGDDPLWLYWLSKLRRLGGHTLGLALVVPLFLAWGPARRQRVMLFLGYLGAGFAVFVQGTFAGYHHLPGLAIGSILVGTLFSQAVTVVVRDSAVRVGGLRITTRLLLAQAVIVAALPFYWERERLADLLGFRFLAPPRAGEFRIGTVFDFTESYDVARYLRERTDPGDAIQVWGHESLVYYLAERDAASRFQTSNPLVMRVPGQPITPMQRRWREEFLRDVAARRPRYIAVVTGDAWWWAPGERTSEQLLDDFPEWDSFIRDGYVPDGRVGRFLVYCASKR